MQNILYSDYASILGLESVLVPEVSMNLVHFFRSYSMKTQKCLVILRRPHPSLILKEDHPSTINERNSKLLRLDAGQKDVLQPKPLPEVCYTCDVSNEMAKCGCRGDVRTSRQEGWIVWCFVDDFRCVVAVDATSLRSCVTNHTTNEKARRIRSVFRHCLVTM